MRISTTKSQQIKMSGSIFYCKAQDCLQSPFLGNIIFKLGSLSILHTFLNFWAANIMTVKNLITSWSQLFSLSRSKYSSSLSGLWQWDAALCPEMYLGSSPLGGGQPTIGSPLVTHQGCAGRSFFQRGGAGRGEDKNPRGGAKKRVNQLIQKFDKSA